MKTKPGDKTIARRNFLMKATAPILFMKFRGCKQWIRKYEKHKLELSNLIDVMEQYNS